MKKRTAVTILCFVAYLSLPLESYAQDSITLKGALLDPVEVGQPLTLTILLEVINGSGPITQPPCALTLTPSVSTTPVYTLSPSIWAPPGTQQIPVPASLPMGVYVAKLTCANGVSSTAPETVTIGAPPPSQGPPTIEGWGPSPVTSGSNQTIQGVWFGNTQGKGQINFLSSKGNYQIQNVTSWSNTTIQYTLPNVEPGSYQMSVYTDNNGNSQGVTVEIVQSAQNSQNLGPVWGFADLHSHPASHLAFGSDGNGENGLFWGKPAHDGGLDLATSFANIANDMPSCPSASVGPISLGFTHNNAAGADLIKLISDSEAVSLTDGQYPGWAHQAQGGPDFMPPNNAEGWPSALTVDHQVMHIDSIRRAYQGGLRLLFASVTNNEIISKLWNQGFNASGNPMPTHDPSFDFDSAVTQLTYITNLVNANSTWMQIVTAPSQARSAINSNPPKLAVVLSLEMDSLSLDQIQKLVQQFGVAHVIPVHLVDSSFGGTALYSDTFNGLNKFINGSYYKPASDNNVNFTLASPPAFLIAISPSTTLNATSGQVSVGSIITAEAASVGPPGWIADAVEWVAEAALGVNVMPTGALGYLPFIPPPVCPFPHIGQINSTDLNQNQFFALMQMGLLLDIAHMGQRTASTALAMAQKYHYPLMDSHTQIRCDSTSNCPKAPAGGGGAPLNAQTSGILGVNERNLPISQLQIIKQLGGVIGIGEAPGFLPPCGGEAAPDPDPVGSWMNSYSIAFSLMGNKGVAIGTDANGLSPLLERDTQPTNYPITVASQFGCPNASCPSLSQYQLGKRTFNFQNDGIATYGLLADFIQAASQSRPVSVPYVPDPTCMAACQTAFATCRKLERESPASCAIDETSCQKACPATGGGFVPGPVPKAQIAGLFHSAEDTIEMWEAVEAALIITTPRYLQGEAATPFSQTLSARGGTPPYTWSIQSGSTLPPGLTLSKDGKISGTGTKAGPYLFTIVVQDSTTPTALSSTLEFGMTLLPQPCDQTPDHQIVMCGTPAVKTCIIPPAQCPPPTCNDNQVLKDGQCVPKGAGPS